MNGTEYSSRKVSCQQTHRKRPPQRERAQAQAAAKPRGTLASMKRCLIVLVVTCAAVVHGQTPSDEAAVRATIAAYVEAREHTDPRAVEVLFTEDADQLVSTGEWRKGRAAVVTGTVAST